MKKAIQRLKNERGLTLVELLAVIVILAIVMIIAFVFIGGIIENSKKDAHIANAQQVIAAAKLYEASGGNLDSGVTVEALQDGNYLDVNMLDPWTKNNYSLSGSDAVSKNASDEYQVTFASSECTITAKTEADLATEDRDTLCP